MKKVFLILPSLLLLLCLCTFIVFKALPIKSIPFSPHSTIQASPSPVQNGYTFQATESGKTALEITKENIPVEVKHYDFGDMVTGINGVMADTGHFWSLSVNGKSTETGAGTTVVKKGDTVGWKYETITQ